MSKRGIGLLLLVAGAAGAVACGDAPPPPAPPAVTAPVLPRVPSVPLPERARYALDRLLRGPRPLGGLVVPEIHPRNLEMATDDLVALAPHTARLLADSGLVERVTGMALIGVRPPARPNGDPWLNVLHLLLGLPDVTPQTVIAWTEPVLGIAPDSPLSGLRTEATRLLGRLRDERAGPLLLALLEAGAGDREVGIAALPALLALASPWRERALDVALLAGSPSLWSGVPTSVQGEGSDDGSTAAREDALAWWAALVEGSGPRVPTELPERKTYAWMVARLLLDPATAAFSARGAAPRYGPLPASVTRGAGWMAGGDVAPGVFPLFGYSFDGKESAAQARCRLAVAGYGAYAASVRADLAAQALPAGDGALHRVARDCPLDDRGTREAGIARGRLRALLDAAAPPSLSDAMAVAERVGELPGCEAEEDWALLVRVLSSLRPLDVWRAALERAYDHMEARADERRALLETMLARRAEDAEGAGVALYLIRRSGDAAYIPALEAQFAAARAGERISGLRTLLIYMHAGDPTLGSERREAFVRRLVQWADELPDARGETLLPALLDFGSPGARAFARGLSGPDRERYLRAWPSGGGLVPVEVAEAAAATVARHTAHREVERILALAYVTFPSEAAPALAGLRQRVASALRPLVDVALERVVHRAPRGALPIR